MTTVWNSGSAEVLAANLAAARLPRPGVRTDAELLAELDRETDLSLARDPSRWNRTTPTPRRQPSRAGEPTAVRDARLLGALVEHGPLTVRELRARGVLDHGHALARLRDRGRVACARLDGRWVWRATAAG
jgi:hypothetical protein